MMYQGSDQASGAELLRTIHCTIRENKKYTVKRLFKPLSDAALRQLVDSTSIFQAWRAAARQARAFEGGMYFKREGVYEYLIRTTRDNRQSRLGRSDGRDGARVL